VIARSTGERRAHRFWRGLLLVFAATAATIAPSFGQTLAIEIVQAAPAYDPRTGDPVVTFRMSPSSARAFADLTAKNVGRAAAIVIDGRVMSQPIIREPIQGGAGQVAGNFSAEQARTIANGLASGTSKMDITIVPAHGVK
jgi:preprotein translocase subunit SecD